MIFKDYVLYLTKIRTSIMITFQQYLGFIIFAVIATAGFWIMIFLLSILPYWIFGYFKDLRAQKKAKKEGEVLA